MDDSPLRLDINGTAYDVLDRIAIGSVCIIYRCRFTAGRGTAEGVFKIARDARTNPFVASEAAILRMLHAAPDAGGFAPFLPAVVASATIADDATGMPRQANVLRLHEAIHSPDELYTLAEVRQHHPDGVDPKDVAWIWRRLLNILGFIHAHNVIHTAVLPMHVLIEPREHKLVLVDWCCAVPADRAGADPATVLAGGYRDWYKREGFLRQPPTPALDIALGARCMLELLGGDPVRGQFPPGMEPALERYFGRCMNGGSGTRQDAHTLLADFDRLIDALWGPRQFHVMELPPKQRI